METNGQSFWQERAARFFCYLAVAVSVWLGVRLAGSVLGVLLIAWVVAAIVDPLSRKTSRLLHLPRRLCAALYVLLFLATAVSFGVLAVRRLTEELRELFDFAQNNQEVLGQRIHSLSEKLRAVWERLPFLSALTAENGEAALRESAEAALADWLQQGIRAIGEGLASGAGRLVRGFPRMLITLIVTVMACLYLSMDYQELLRRVFVCLPLSAQKKATAMRPRLQKAIRSYLRAYLLLFLLTFCEVFVGLLLLRQRYAFLLALLVSLVDILPVLGAGTVLIPWAVFLLLCRQYSTGFGLLILYGVVTIVRQIAEPHALGSHLGLHPLVSLLSMFAGFRLFGILGMLAGPAVAMLVREYFRTDGDAAKLQQKTSLGK